MTTPVPPELLAAFDRGGDPLDDPQLRAWLEDHPEHLATFASLRARVTDVGSVPVDTVWPALPAWRRPLVGLAAGGLLAAAIWFAVARPGPVEVVPATLPGPTLAARAGIRSLVVTTHIVGSTDTFVGTQQPGRLARHSRRIHIVTSRPSPAVTVRSTLSVEESFAP